MQPLSILSLYLDCLANNNNAKVSSFFRFFLSFHNGCKSDDYQKAKTKLRIQITLLNDAQTSHEVELIYSDFIKRMSTLHIYDEKENEIIENEQKI